MIRSYIFLLTILILPILSMGQVTVDQNFHDFGNVSKGHMRLAEFNLMNNGDKNVLILRADQDPELDIRFSTKTVEPGAYATIRVQINPRSKGRFKKSINLWISTSQEPFVLEMEANIKELEESFQPCPTFRNPDKIQPIIFNMNAYVTNILTGASIEGASISLIRNGVVIGEPLITNKIGQVSQKIPIGQYYVIVKKEGYETREAVIYLNRNQNKVKAKLKAVEVTEIIQSTVAKEVILDDKPEVTQPEPAEITELDPGDFSANHYSANNLVFLIDVSASMRKDGRMDLLKASMLELVDILREIDQVSILTYTSTSKMVLESIPATESNKELMRKIIQGLEAKGSTVGGQAVRSAYEVVQANYINNGRNQIMMATDGQFRDNYPAMLKMVKKNSKHGRHFSVIGIKNGRKSAEQMLEMATIGSGYYINIESFTDAQVNLVNGIKASSLKK